MCQIICNKMTSRKFLHKKFTHNTQRLTLSSLWKLNCYFHFHHTMKQLWNLNLVRSDQSSFLFPEVNPSTVWPNTVWINKSVRIGVTTVFSTVAPTLVSLVISSGTCRWQVTFCLMLSWSDWNVTVNVTNILIKVMSRIIVLKQIVDQRGVDTMTPQVKVVVFKKGSPALNLQLWSIIPSTCALLTSFHCARTPAGRMVTSARSKCSNGTITEMNNLCCFLFWTQVTIYWIF